MNDPRNAQASGVKLVPDHNLGHAGERTMRERFPSRNQWGDESLTKMMNPVIPQGMANFINAQPFFFLATASAEGHCDASFRGQEYDAEGRPLPALLVLSEDHLIFPDYPGNGLYNSLGNILVNPHVGILIVDFERQSRLQLNGIAEIKPANADMNAVWPLAQSIVVVKVEQVYSNCSKRVPKMTMRVGGG